MFTLPDLPYSSSALEPYIDTQTMEIHHGKHHAAYVKNLNDALSSYPDLLQTPIETVLSRLNQIPENIRQKVTNHGGGHSNHSLFWPLMTPKSAPPAGALLDAIDSFFGSLDQFQEKFTAAAMGRFGSGWAWLVAASGKLEIMDTPNQDTPLSQGKIPLLGLDVWEHAYYLKYQNRRNDYISAWWHVVNWDQVTANFQAV
ncbi:superoxide dismutase [Candidatus Amesbacteria bacterium RIFOXYB1_FULL_47_12]|nr:MAG: superoxide dismutase [Candidatus Amesbacteria bacterium RIFOXYB1_FULL_47_12]